MALNQEKNSFNNLKRNKMEIKIENGKWIGNLILIDLFINLQRTFDKPLVRTKIDKKHNYQFKFDKK